MRHRDPLQQRRRVLHVCWAALAIAAVAMAAAGSSGTASPVTKRPRAAIVFTAGVGSEKDAELFRVLPNGQGLQRLTRDRLDVGGPAWSYDRRRIAFTNYAGSSPCSQSNCTTRVWTMDANGRNLKRLTPFPSRDLWFENGASWSPNGRSLVFSAFPAGTVAFLYTIRRDGSHLRRIASTSAASDWDPESASPTWGPNGWIALNVNSTVEGGSGIFLLRPDGTGWRRLVATPDDKLVSNPVWNASGSRLAFAQPELHQITVLVTATGEIARTVRIPRSIGYIAWSPDSRTFAFSSNGGIYLIGSDGRNLRRLGAGSAAMRRLRAPSSPDWR